MLSFSVLVRLELATITKRYIESRFFYLHLADTLINRSIVAERQKMKPKTTFNLVAAQIQISGRKMLFKRTHYFKPQDPMVNLKYDYMYFRLDGKILFWGISLQLHPLSHIQTNQLFCRREIFL